MLLELTPRTGSFFVVCGRAYSCREGIDTPGNFRQAVGTVGHMIDVFPKRHLRVVDMFLVVPDCRRNAGFGFPSFAAWSLVNDRISLEVPIQPATVSVVRLSVTQVAWSSRNIGSWRLTSGMSFLPHQVRFRAQQLDTGDDGVCAWMGHQWTS